MGQILMVRTFLGKIAARRIPQVVGIYLAAGWGLLEFSDWAVRQFGLAISLETSVFTVWAIFFPAVVAAAWRFSLPAGARIPISAPAPRSVAVLPFLNLSGSPEDEYLSDGITDEVIGALAKVESLRVVARTSSFAFKGTQQDIRMIGKALNVASVLEGSIQKSAGQIRVTTQLIDVGSGYHLWSERYDRKIENIFAIEDDIAECVARALKVILHEKERRALSRIPTANAQAYEYYLRGRQFLLQTRRRSLQFARDMYLKAIDLDPAYALAYAGLADSICHLCTYYPATEVDLDEADRASKLALELAPDLAEAHAARGGVHFAMGRLEDAEREFKTAIRQDSKLFGARYFYARACFQMGRFEDAARMFEEALAVREDYQAAFFLAQSQEAMGESEAAADGYQTALEVVERHMDLNPDDPRAATMRAVALCHLGRPEEGLRWAREALEIDPEDAGVRYNVACLYALEGKIDEAITCLEEAIEVGFGNREWLERDPDIESLRGDPRFAELMARI